jgi:lipid-A-disaccharide synthase-like uncharacterized protein
MSDSKLWLVIGILGQSVFFARFLAQWIASERKRDSVVPIAFWWLSLAGGLTTLFYAIHREEPVWAVGQAMGIFIYTRNLMLVAKGKRRAAHRTPGAATPTIPAPHSPRIDALESQPTLRVLAYPQGELDVSEVNGRSSWGNGNVAIDEPGSSSG